MAEPETVTFLVVKDGAGHRVVAPLVGDSVAELEARAVVAVDRAIDGHVLRRDFNGRIVVAFKQMPCDDVEAQRTRIEALLQARANAFGGVTALGRPLKVMVTVGLDDPDPPLDPSPPSPPSPQERPPAAPSLADREMPFDKFFDEGYVVRDVSRRDSFASTIVAASLLAIFTAVLWLTEQPAILCVLSTAIVVALVATLPFRARRGRRLLLFRDRLEIHDRARTRTIPFADVDAFSFKVSPVPGKLVLTKKTLLVRFRPSRGGEIEGSDGRFYDEAIEGDFVPLGSMALAVVLTFRSKRWREERP